MRTKQLVKRAVQVIGSTMFVALCSTEALGEESVPVGSNGTPGGHVYPFPSKFVLPSGVPAGTIVARGYFTPRQACGYPKCRLVVFKPVSGAVDGSNASLNEVWLNARVIVKGKVQEKFSLYDN